MAEPADVDWSFARRPRWVLSHLFVLALVVTMFAAGLWQLARHSERRDRNDRIQQLAGVPAVPFDELIAVDDPADVGESEQHRRVFFEGTFQAEDQVLIRNRTLNGSPGMWVITPMLGVDERTAVAVNRGWIPLSTVDASAGGIPFDPPRGVVRVEGTVQPSRVAGWFQQSDPAGGVLSSMLRPDIERLAEQVDYPLPAAVLRVAPPELNGTANGTANGTTNGTEAGTLPVPIPAPPLDGGPHLGYAVQWFVFTTIALVGYPLILRRAARGESQSLPDDL